MDNRGSMTTTPYGVVLVVLLAIAIIVVGAVAPQARVVTQLVVGAVAGVFAGVMWWLVILGVQTAVEHINERFNRTSVSESGDSA